MKLPPFSSRTLLLGIAAAMIIFLSWIGWQAYFVKERLWWLDTVLRRGGSVIYYDVHKHGRLSLSPIPWYRYLLGDKAVLQLSLYRGCNREDQDKIEWLFSDAQVYGHIHPVPDL